MHPLPLDQEIVIPPNSNNIFGHYSKVEVGLIKFLYEEQGLTAARRTQLKSAMLQRVPVKKSALGEVLKQFKDPDTEVELTDTWFRKGRKGYRYDADEMLEICTGSNVHNGSSRGNKQAFKDINEQARKRIRHSRGTTPSTNTV